MREKYLEVFDRIWIDNLNGDKYKTGKLTPEGKPDPSAFSTEFNREGIQVGTAVSLLVRKHDSHDGGDLDLTAGWGHAGKGGVTMPGKGRAVARPGAASYDVYLNDKAFWSNIPSAVWEYTLGGYQVMTIGLCRLLGWALRPRNYMNKGGAAGAFACQLLIRA